jgi:hypothetical protein
MLSRVYLLCLAAALAAQVPLTVPDTPTKARTPGGEFISWVEHLIDDQQLGGVPIRGADGLQMADFDRDGYLDIVSVHEDSDHVRLAFGSKDRDKWSLVTLAEGKEAPAAEDASVGDVNGDGYPDIIVACELAHLIYFQNPGKTARSGKWPRAILENTRNRGSFIRVFFADLDNDGRLEAVAANKGEQLPTDKPGEPTPEALRDKLAISWFAAPENPLDGRGWKEHELIRMVIPINSQPVDIDSDGDMDIIAGSRGEARMVIMRNDGGRGPRFTAFPVLLEGLPAGARPPWGFMIAVHDFSGDRRPDLVVAGAQSAVMWLEQPAQLEQPWKAHFIGSIRPDTATGITAADINSDGRPDVITGGYSQNPRDHDGPRINAESVSGRIAWFENNGPGKPWSRHDITRAKRGMYDAFLARDMDGDGDVDFIGTRGNSGNFDGVYWIEQVRSKELRKAFQRAREKESEALPLPAAERK